MGRRGLESGLVTAGFVGTGPREGEGVKGTRMGWETAARVPVYLKGERQRPQPRGPHDKLRAVWVFQQR